MTRVTQQPQVHVEKLIFMSLVVLCLVLVGLYIYFLCASVSQVVMRTDINQQTVAVSSDISELENTYITQQHKVSEEIVSLQGYTTTDKKVFIDRGGQDSLAISNGDVR